MLLMYVLLIFFLIDNINTVEVGLSMMIPLYLGTEGTRMELLCIVYMCSNLPE